MDYYWKLFQKSWSCNLYPFGIGRFFPSLRGRNLSFGFWVKFSTDAVLPPPCNGRTDNNSHSIYKLLAKHEFRLFVLHPGHGSEPLCGHLVQAKCSWKQDPEYEALSYVWGDPSNASSMFIDGCQSSINQNLESALRHLRSEEEPRTLWIDAICINQSDILERNSQVRMMGWIYENAKNVNIWLGAATPHSAIGIEILSYLATSTDTTSKPPWEIYPPCLAKAGLNDIMSREWFRRIWVVQEAAASRKATIICGSYHFSWTGVDVNLVYRFLRMIKLAEISPQWEQAELSTIDMSSLLDLLDLQIGRHLERGHGGNHRRPKDLLDVVHGMRHKASTDPRDKIIGLLGVPVTYDVEDFNVDYSMTVEEVYLHLRSVVNLG